MTFCKRLSKNRTSQAFFASRHCHPQTLDVLRTRAEPLGIEVVVGDESAIEDFSAYFGALLQYPTCDGEIVDYRELVSRFHAVDALVAVAADLLALTLLANLPIAIGLAVQRWRQGSATARLYLVGFGLVLGSVSLGVMRATALVQPTSANAMVFPLALTLEALLFSLALASRIQDLKQERALALDQADQEKNARLALLHSAQRDLARAVEVRTNELSEANRQLQMREAQLQYAAHHDPLTGLGNRRHLMEFAESALDDARRHGNSMALLLIDLDHFKPINDTHGHDAGDFVLQNVAQRLRHCVRTEDCVARLGGDEFAVLVGGSNAEQHARDIAERLLRELAKPVEFAKQWLVITPSIGVALFPGDALQFGKLYKAADQALYRVKGAGRAGYAMAADDERETAPALPWPTALAPERIS